MQMQISDAKLLCNLWKRVRLPSSNGATGAYQTLHVCSSPGRPNMTTGPYTDETVRTGLSSPGSGCLNKNYVALSPQANHTD
jgi:hypothetical protein